MVVMAPLTVAMPNTATEMMKQTIWTNVTQYVKNGLETTQHFTQSTSTEHPFSSCHV